MLFFWKLPQIQTSVTTYWRYVWWEVLYRFCWKFNSLSGSERIL